MRSRASAIVVAIVVPVAVLGFIIARSGGGHSPARLPIAASSGGEAAGTAAAQLDPAGGITYVAAPGLPALDGNARAYTVTGSQDPDKVRALADALGLHGDVTSDPEGGYTVVDGDAQLTVYPYAGGGWSYVRQSSGGGVASSGTITPCGPEGDCAVPETTIPQRPTSLPSSDEAKQLVLDLLDKAGVSTTSVAVTVDDLTTEMAVQVDPIVDGVTTQGFGTSVTIGDGGVIEYASGTLGHPQPADEYPLIGTAKAIDLLNQGRGFVGPVPLAGVAEATDLPATVPAANGTSFDSTTPGSPGSPLQPCDGTGAPTTFACTPVTPDTPPITAATLPPPQQITITGAERILILATSYDGRDSFLVPGYRFTTSSGGTVSVLAIDDSFLAPPPGQSDGTKSAPDVTIEPAPSPEPLPPQGAPGPPATAPASVEPGNVEPPNSGGPTTGG
jgi:hypothetical protein